MRDALKDRAAKRKCGAKRHGAGGAKPQDFGGGHGITAAMAHGPMAWAIMPARQARVARPRLRRASRRAADVEAFLGPRMHILTLHPRQPL
ncbi:hypothetical protein PF005_g5403 [Phytophthora fragariae]|uniref:Uncharacterized protein n=2 Tax=Phytophthora TaxID=4783 RepID=A0A6A3TC58_9STRA|nr:hypothetical protein PF003_g22404 [Phytophthora fragariae]KAE9044073.1 hypothetical protein PR002_g2994 [Phytophthora rubi]KAE8944586.1 hypothetical protein PF009_g5745 [Phytophthora fragariae]KAE9023182.1 hypothetical protein PF011_g4130 [Phytophthora fragariae]KAE9049729.1 hypothetical protein PR001_g3015 [Phytophthora rubi]